MIKKNDLTEKITIMKEKDYTAPHITLIQLDTESCIMTGSFNTPGYDDGSMFLSSSGYGNPNCCMMSVESAENVMEDRLTVKK